MKTLLPKSAAPFAAAILCAAGLVLGAAPASAQVQGVTKDSIKIGMHNSLTGPIAVFGLTYERVARLLSNAAVREGVMRRDARLIDPRFTTQLRFDARSGPTLAPAKAFVGRRALRAAGQLIQVSGGIAVAEEYKLTHCNRRLHVAAALFGSAEAQLARIDVRAQLLAA